MKKSIYILTSAAIAAISIFSFAGCAFADNVQANCNHKWVLQKNSSYLRDATCSEQGITAVYGCVKCQKLQFEYSPKLPHTFNGEGDTVEYTCGSQKTYIHRKCTVCKSDELLSVPVACHKFGEATHHDAYEATLVDIGLYTQEEYDALPQPVIDADKINHSTELQEKSECAHTERKCAKCKYTEKVYEHGFSDATKQTIEDFTAEVRASGGCGSTLTVTCDFCGEDVQIFFHVYEVREIIYSSSELVIKKYVCKICNSEEKYEVQYL